MRDFFEWLDKWLSPQTKITTQEDVADSLVLFAILVLLLYVTMKG